MSEKFEDIFVEAKELSLFIAVLNSEMCFLSYFYMFPLFFRSYLTLERPKCIFYGVKQSARSDRTNATNLFAPVNVRLHTSGSFVVRVSRAPRASSLGFDACFRPRRIYRRSASFDGVVVVNSRQP